MRDCTLADKMKYYGSYQAVIKEHVIKQTIKRNNIIYGSQAVAEITTQVHLTRKPRDWDILSRNPKRDSAEMIKALNEHFGCEMFNVLYKKRYDAAEKKLVHVYTVKNMSICYPYTEKKCGMSFYTPSTRYSPVRSEREELKQYRTFSEIDYTLLQGNPSYTYVDSEWGRFKVKPLNVIKEHRKDNIDVPEKEYRREKDKTMISDITRYQKIKQQNQHFAKGQFTVIDPNGRQSVASVKGAIQDKKKRYR